MMQDETARLELMCDRAKHRAVAAARLRIPLENRYQAAHKQYVQHNGYVADLEATIRRRSKQLCKTLKYHHNMDVLQSQLAAARVDRDTHRDATQNADAALKQAERLHTQLTIHHFACVRALRDLRIAAREEQRDEVNRTSTAVCNAWFVVKLVWEANRAARDKVTVLEAQKRAGILKPGALKAAEEKVERLEKTSAHADHELAVAQRRKDDSCTIYRTMGQSVDALNARASNALGTARLVQDFDLERDWVDHLPADVAMFLHDADTDEVASSGEGAKSDDEVL